LGKNIFLEKTTSGSLIFRGVFGIMASILGSIFD